ncbi:MAG: amidohydrolase family protein [Chloroflexota bacterium]
MFIVDTHCHVSQTWYEPVESLLYQMDQNDVAQAILIQIGGQYNNSYQVECVAKHPDRLASVVIVDAAHPDALAHLEQEKEAGAVGVRLSANTRSAGDDPFAIWRKAEALGLVVSCSGGRDGFLDDSFASLIEAVPNLPIIIEHLGNVNKPEGGTPPDAIWQKVYGLSRYPNVYIKIHGLGEFCTRARPVQEPFPFEQPIPPLLKFAYKAFGPERMMWGSDFPPVSGREGYQCSLQLTLAQFEDKPQTERDLIFGGVAQRVFKC